MLKLNKYKIRAKSTIKRLLKSRGLILVEGSRYSNACAALARAVKELLPAESGRLKSGAEGIVFSKDRPLQLHGLLKSYYELCENPSRLTVIYAASKEAYIKAYAQVETCFRNRNVKFVREDEFRNTLISILNAVESDKLFFLVDDNIFIRPVDFEDFLDFDLTRQVPSLRLSPALAYCYTLGVHQNTPNMKRVEKVSWKEPKLIWKWSDGEHDWGYPLSVDGNCFSTKEMRVMCRLLDYSAPNSLEVSLQWFQGIYKGRDGLCYLKSKIINIPFNKVQTENDNLSSDISPSTLLRYWQDGLEIDTARYRGIKNRSAHEELDLYLKSRDASNE